MAPKPLLALTSDLLRLCRDDVYDDDDDYGHYGEEEDVGQQGLQPTKEDPGLFIVTCRCVLVAAWLVCFSCGWVRSAVSLLSQSEASRWNAVVATALYRRRKCCTADTHSKVFCAL